MIIVKQNNEPHTSELQLQEKVSQNVATQTWNKQDKMLQHKHETNKTVNVRKGARGGVVVKALLYKLAGRGFDSR